MLLAVLYLLTALGGATPLYGWLYRLAPPVRYLRFAALFRCIYLFAVVALALLACRGASWRISTRTAIAMAATAFAAFGWAAWRSAGGQHKTPNLILAAVCMAAVWSAVVWLAHRARWASGVQRKRMARWFVALAVVDAAATMALSEWTVYGSDKPWRAMASDRVVSMDLHDLDRRLSCAMEGMPLSANLVSKKPYLDGYPCMGNAFHAAYVRCPTLSASALGGRRIWFAPRGVEMPPTTECFQRFAADARRRGRPGLVLAPPDECFRHFKEPTPPDKLAAMSDRLAELPPLQQVSATLSKYVPNRLVFEAAAPADGWLLVTDRWAAGWRAKVNDEPADVWIGNFIFRAVRVQRGNNRIEFDYRPAGHPWLLVLSWATLCGVGAATAFQAKKHVDNFLERRRLHRGWMN